MAIEPTYRRSIMHIAPSTTHPPGLLILMHDVPADIEDDFNRWYVEEHFAERLCVPGMQMVCRYRATASQPTYMVVYRSDAIEDFVSTAYREVLEQPTQRTKTILTRFQNVLRAACRQTWTSNSRAIGGAMIVVQCKAIAGSQDVARNYIKEQLCRHLEKTGSLISMTLCESDALITSASNSELVRRALPDHYADWIVLVQGYDAVKLSLALHSAVMQSDSRNNGLLIGSLTRYELMCALSADHTPAAMVSPLS